MTTPTEQGAFWDGQTDGFSDGRRGEFRPADSIPSMTVHPEESSAYADGYWAGWMSGCDAREAGAL